MGEVWRATDTRLGRDVAMKVLPAGLLLRPGPARPLRARGEAPRPLNHPNIATIYGLEEIGGERALVMELVEGEDALRADEARAAPSRRSAPYRPADRARRSRRPTGRGSSTATSSPRTSSSQWTARSRSSTSAWPRRWIRRRAPASGADLARSPTLMNSPTLTAAGTKVGVILGTAAYMAPEQAKGHAVDKRADIWAFGVVLCEMLTGRRLFEGDSVPETLAGVLKSEIDLATLPAGTPPEIRQLLRRCLERKTKSRLHDIADARHRPRRRPGRADGGPASRRPRRAAKGVARGARLAGAAGLARGRPRARRAGRRRARPAVGRRRRRAARRALADLLRDEPRREHLPRRPARRLRLDPRRHLPHLAQAARERRGGGADRRERRRATDLSRLELGAVRRRVGDRSRSLPRPARRRRAPAPGPRTSPAPTGRPTDGGSSSCARWASAASSS